MKKKRLFAYVAVIAVLIAAFALMGASCSVFNGKYPECGHG